MAFAWATQNLMTFTAVLALACLGAAVAVDLWDRRASKCRR